MQFYGKPIRPCKLFELSTKGLNLDGGASYHVATIEASNWIHKVQKASADESEQLRNWFNAGRGLRMEQILSAVGVGGYMTVDMDGLDGTWNPCIHPRLDHHKPYTNWQEVELGDIAGGLDDISIMYFGTMGHSTVCI